MINTILADDHKLFSEGVEKLLSGSGFFKIIKKFHNPKDLLETIDSLEADLLILDIDMPGLSGIDVIKRVRVRNKSLKIVMLSMHEENVFLQEAHSLGADGYLNKAVESFYLIESLLRICEGEKFFPTFRNAMPTTSSPLSDRETQVLRQLAKGKTSESIAQEMNISQLTVKTHRSNMMRKLKVNNAAELISKALERGYI